jgi:hypothetical protein
MGQRQFETKLYYQLSLERRLNGSDSREQITFCGWRKAKRRARHRRSARLQ